MRVGQKKAPKENAARAGRATTMRTFAAPVTRFFGRSTNRPVVN